MARVTIRPPNRNSLRRRGGEIEPLVVTCLTSTPGNLCKGKVADDLGRLRRSAAFPRQCWSPDEGDRNHGARTCNVPHDVFELGETEPVGRISRRPDRDVALVVQASNAVPVILKTLNIPACLTYADVYRGTQSDFRKEGNAVWREYAPEAAAFALNSRNSCARGTKS